MSSSLSTLIELELVATVDRRCLMDDVKIFKLNYLLGLSASTDFFLDFSSFMSSMFASNVDLRLAGDFGLLGVKLDPLLFYI